jgi:hypothetical protein
MEDFEKQEVLKNLRNKDIDTLWGYIEHNEISLDEMKQARGLIFDVKKELEHRLEKREDDLRKEAEKETNFWNECQNKNTKDSYNEYLTRYPNGQYKTQAEDGISRIARHEEEVRTQAETRFWNECHQKGTKRDYIAYLNAYPDGTYVAQANAMLTRIMVEGAEKKRQLIQEMKDYPEHFDHSRVQQLFDDEILEKEDLFEEGIITEKALRLYLRPPLDKFIDQRTWGDLPVIPEGKTDVYFFGIPGSGKSCVLAGLLYAAEKRGILRPDTSIKHGFKYMNELTRCVEVGYVPKPTAADNVNCLSFSLSSDKEHPLNVIEMSGEIFKNTYYDLVGERNDGITARRYLKNKNRKIIFFVIDYRSDFAATDTADLDVGQARMLTSILEILKDDSILTQTDGLVIIISKSDYMPRDKDRQEVAGSYLYQEYLNFIKILEGYLRKYGINKATNYKPYVIPFSLGQFMLGRTFTYNGADSAIVVNTLLTLSRIKRSGWF